MHSRTENGPPKELPPRHVPHRPLRPAVIVLSCGCTFEILSADEIIPQRDTVLWCHSHRCNVKVRDVEME